MLSSLSIRNFKSWKETGDIELSPLTLFFGANSSGKSSIAHFLMMLKQTVESSDQNIVLYPGGKNTPVNVGSFQEFIHNRDTRNDLAFSYQWELAKELIIPKGENKSLKGNFVTFMASIRHTNSSIGVSLVDRFEYQVSREGDKKANSYKPMIGMEKTSDSQQYKLVTEHIKLKRNRGRGWQLKAPIKYYGFPDEVVAYHQNADFVKELNLAQENLFKKVFYLGPLRDNAERVYSWAGIEPDSVGYSGERTIAAMLSAKDRMINFKKKAHRFQFEKIIALKLKEMGLIESFKVHKVSKERQDFEVLVKTRGSSKEAILPDVGFGISQVLPVIVELFYAPPNSIILMEQPEIHLHPAAQSVLADVMIDAVNSHENGKKRNIQLIIESHSEHFLRRLQRRIAEGDRISEKDVSIYFAHIDKTPTRLERLQVDSFGNIINWPKNFFGDEMEDIGAKTKAGLEKRKKELMGASNETAR